MIDFLSRVVWSTFFLACLWLPVGSIISIIASINWLRFVIVPILVCAAIMWVCVVLTMYHEHFDSKGE